MGYKLKIDETEYDLKDGFTIKEEFNETLDSATVQFATYGEELSKEPFDYAVIYHTDNLISNKYFEVDSITDDIYAFGDYLDDSDHQYTMSLFSETKELERITLPSCSVTQPTDPNATRTTVWDEIQRFCSAYLPEIKAWRGDAPEYIWTYQPKFSLDYRLQSRFNSIPCPEFQWNNPTLREVLNDLMSVDDCIVVVRQHVISFFDLKRKGSAIDTTKLSRMTSHFSSADYISELTMFMKNGVGKNNTKSFGYQACRTSDESGEITTHNQSITTQKPIYAVKSLKIYFIYDKKLHCVDVADRVIEYDDFKTKSRIYVSNTLGSAYSRLPTWTDHNGCALPEHQVNYLYYKRGGNTIENLTKQYNGSRTFTFLSTGYLSICNTLRSMDATFINNFGNWLNENSRNMFYEIEYETLYEHAMHFGKNIANKHPENRTFDGQSNSYVDIEHQSIFEYAKVNRLSNQIKEIYGEYETEDEVPALGDYIDDFILFSKETTYFDEKILFKGYLTKNYILKDYYTGVMAKKRSWQIASQEESFAKFEIIKAYVEASFFRKNDSFTTNKYSLSLGNTGHGLGLVYDLAHVGSIDSDVVGGKILKDIRVYTKKGSSTYFPESGKAIAMDSEIEILGNSLCWTFGFEDNYKAADYMVKDDDLYTQNFYTYGDENAEYDNMYIYVCYNMPDELVDSNGDPLTLPTPYQQGGDDEISNADRNAIYDVVRAKPLVNNDSLGSLTGVYGFSIRNKNKKDTREIIKTTIQFEYCSDTPDIIVKPKFLEFVRAFKANGSDSDIKVWVATAGGKYDINTTTPKGASGSGSYLVYTSLSESSVKLEQTFLSYDNIETWCITDSNNNILIAVNGKDPIYFNLLMSRDTNIYYSVLDRRVIGNIKIEPTQQRTLQSNPVQRAALIENDSNSLMSSRYIQLMGHADNGVVIDKTQVIIPTFDLSD